MTGASHLLAQAFHEMSLLDCDCGYVLHGLYMTHGNTVMPVISRCSYGTFFLDHLATDGAGLTGGQVTVVAVLQVDADFPWCPFYILN